MVGIDREVCCSRNRGITLTAMRVHQRAGSEKCYRDRDRPECASPPDRQYGRFCALGISRMRQPIQHASSAHWLNWATA